MTYQASELAVGVDILTSRQDDATGTLLLQTGDVLAGTTESDDCEFYQQPGFASRPAVPTPGQAAAQAVVVRQSDHDVVIAVRDPRSQAIYGNLAAGESCLYAPASQARVMLKADGGVVIYTTDDNTKDGRGIYFKISPTKGLEYSCPWGRMNFGPLGFHVVHSGGARIDLGAVGGLPGPLASLGSYAKLEGGITSIKGGAVSLGTDGGAANEAAVTALASYLASLVTALGAAFTAVGVAGAANGPAGATSLAGAMAAPTAALTTLLAPIGKVI